MNDNVNALYCDPNAYIRREKSDKPKGIKQVVFSEPYDCLPNYYINYGFKKGDCKCIPKHKDKNCNQNKDCNNYKKNFNTCKNDNCKNSFGGFIAGLSNFLPLLLKGGSGGLSNILSTLNAEGSTNTTTANLISSLAGGQGNDILSGLLSNGNLLSNLFGLFNKNGNKKVDNNDIVTTDYEIKNYTKV